MPSGVQRPLLYITARTGWTWACARASANASALLSCSFSAHCWWKYVFSSLSPQISHSSFRDEYRDPRPDPPSFGGWREYSIERWYLLPVLWLHLYVTLWLCCLFARKASNNDVLFSHSFWQPSQYAIDYQGRHPLDVGFTPRLFPGARYVSWRWWL